MCNILLIENHTDIQKTNRDLLKNHGYNICLATSLNQARKTIASQPFDIIILEIILTDGNGLDLLREIRTNGNPVPVLLLTALSKTKDEIKGLSEGGDDYVIKPYDHNILLARIHALLRRVKMDAEHAGVLRFGNLHANSITQQIWLNGEEINLKPKEFRLLIFFLRNMGKRFTADELYKNVWGQEGNNSVGTVRVHIKGVRDKLKMKEENYIAIKTVNRKYYICKQWEGVPCAVN